MGASEPPASCRFRSVSAREIEDRIAAVVARQHGVATNRQLVDAGLSPAAVGRRLAAGRFRALHRGVYATTPFLLPLAREMGAVLASGPGSTLSHRSSAGLWGLYAVAAGGPVDVIPARHRSKIRGIRLHYVRQLAADERVVHEGIPVTSPARTILDLAAVLGGRELESIVARAERERLVTVDQLVAMLERSRGRRGVPELRKVLALPGGAALTRSEAERQLLALVRQARLPPPVCNAVVGGYEVDFLWPDAKLAVEVDGYRHHGTRTGFERDRLKDSELVAAGLTVLRVTWRQIAEAPLATVVRLGQALARAATRT